MADDDKTPITRGDMRRLASRLHGVGTDLHARLAEALEDWLEEDSTTPITIANICIRCDGSGVDARNAECGVCDGVGTL